MSMSIARLQNQKIVVNFIPAIGGSLYIEDVGEAIVKAFRELSDGEYLTLEIAEGMTGMVFTMPVEWER